MTREEKLYSMRGAELINEAMKVGVKLAHKGNALKESKEKAVAKILAAYSKAEAELMEAAKEVAQAEPTLSVPMPVEYGENGPQLIEKVEEPEIVAQPKGRGRKKTRKTFEELVADIPAVANTRFIRGSKGSVHVKMGTDSRRLFGYNGPVVIVTDERLVDGLEYEGKSYGYRLAPTAENMLAIFANYKKISI